MSDPAEALAQQVTERVVDLLLSALDVNEIAARIDLNALLGRVDLDAVLDRVDVNALLARVDLKPLLDQIDVNDLVEQVDMDALISRTDLGAVIARSSGGMGSEALDAVRSQVIGLDLFVDRWVHRLLWRGHPVPSAPAALAGADPAPIPARAEP